MGFAAVIVVLVAVWAVLLGAAYAARRAGLSRARSRAAVVGCYAVLAALALSRLGLNGRGLLGVTGMLVPLLVALVLLARPGRTTR